MIRKQFRFKGKVQHVGFRWKARTTAQQLGLTGWVRNEVDGSVRMEVQGEEERISALLLELYTDRYIRIATVQAEEIPVKPEETAFLSVR